MMIFTAEDMILVNKPKIIASDKSWIEGEAIQQLENTSKLPGMVRSVGMPDLHPGKGHPIGAVFITKGLFYPYLIGNDIGCGMALHQLDQLLRKTKLEKLVKTLSDLEGPWGGDRRALREEYKVKNDRFDESLGTIGGGNHFAEFLSVDKVFDQKGFSEMGLDKRNLFLLVHSGSRAYGESVLRKVVDQFKAAPLASGSPEAEDYLNAHHDARAWAKANRALIVRRFLERAGYIGRKVLEVEHNTLDSSTLEGEMVWFHRKGAAPSDQGPIVIPGSRGSYTYLVKPTGDMERSAWSLAHGAGRKWKRADVRAKLNCKVEDLVQTPLGSRVICEDKALMFEEAPQAYKKIEQVIQDLMDHGLIEIVARFRPLVTYKTRRKG